MCMMFSQCNTCSMVIYKAYTIQYHGECGHIEGHAYSIFFVHNETCVFWALGLHAYNYSYEFNNSLMHPRKRASFQNTVKPLNNMRADTLGAGPFVLSREVVLYKN